MLFFLPPLSLSQKHRESVLMVCQIVPFSPTVDRWCGVCVSCVRLYLYVCVCILKGSLAYFSPVVFSVDIAHSAGLYAFQCGQTHTFTLIKQYTCACRTHTQNNANTQTPEMTNICIQVRVCLDTGHVTRYTCKHICPGSESRITISVFVVPELIINYQESVYVDLNVM